MDAYKKLIRPSMIIIALLIILLIVYFFFIKQDQPRQEIGVSLSEPPPAASSAEKKEEKVPPLPAVDTEVLDIELNKSDGPLRELLKDCSAHPEFARWLANRDIIRRSVAVIDNIADGVNPSVHLPFLVPTAGFKVIERNGKIMIDPLSYIRYQPVTMVLASIETEKVLEYYRKLRPVIGDAFKELGYPGRQFEGVLEQALEVLLETPVIEGDILLEEKVRTYAFADPRLETLNDVQKLMLRMGPENTRIIQDKLREIAKALKIR